MFSKKIRWFLCFILTTNSFATQMNILYEWKYVDYLWKNSAQKQNAINSGYKNSSIIIDVDKAPDGRIFVTVVGGKKVPASLNTVSNFRSEAGPLLKPYPNWSWHENNKNCNGITRVYRVSIKCNHLWVLDNGIIENVQVCPAKLLVFDLSKDKLIHKVDIPNWLSNTPGGSGLLIIPIVQNCKTFKTNVYMADTHAGSMIIFNGKRKTLWRLEANAFKAEIKYANHTVAGETFYVPDALFGMALSPHHFWGKSQYLAFTALSSRSLYIADTSEMINSYFTKTFKYRQYLNIFPSEVTTIAFSSKGILFFGLTTDIAIGCWNSHKKLIPENLDIVAQNNENLQFTSGMKIINNHGEKLLIVTNRYQKFKLKTINFNEINFRILQKSVKSLIFNTRCNTKWWQRH